MGVDRLPKREGYLTEPNGARGPSRELYRRVGTDLILTTFLLALAVAAAIVTFSLSISEVAGADILRELSLAVAIVAGTYSIYRVRMYARSGHTTDQASAEDPRWIRAHEEESAVLLRALEVFGDSERALQWMRENNPALKNEPPIHVLHTEEGRREVLNILGRIEHGVIS